SMGDFSARSMASRPTPSGAAKASRMKKRPVSRSQNWLDSAILAPRAASSVVMAATMPGRSAQDRVRTKLAGDIAGLQNLPSGINGLGGFVKSAAKRAALVDDPS